MYSTRENGKIYANNSFFTSHERVKLLRNLESLYKVKIIFKDF